MKLTRTRIAEVISTYVVHIVISLVALGFILVHLTCPDLKIDPTVLALLALAALPWLGKVFKSIELPGGAKVEYRDLLRAEMQASEAGLLSERFKTLGSFERKEAPVYLSIAEEDPNLALAGLRLAIERALRDIAAAHGIGAERKGFGALLRVLSERQIISDEQRSVLNDLSSLLNNAVHGAEVDKRSAEWAMDVGPRLVAGLQSREKQK